MPLTPGKQFEKDFTDSIPDRCDVTRLKDAGGWSKSDDLRFTPKNPCDMVIYSHAHTGCQKNCMYKLELKSMKKKSMPFTNIKPKTPKLTSREASIKFVQALVDSGNKGVMAGFVVNFRDLNLTYIVKVIYVLEFLKTADRSSIPIKWFETNGVLIRQTKKIKHFRYDLEWL